MNNVVVLVLVLLYWLAVARGINVALHGQVNPEEFIVGSAVRSEEWIGGGRGVYDPVAKDSLNSKLGGFHI